MMSNLVRRQYTLEVWNIPFRALCKKPLHEMSVRDINHVFRELGGEHDTKWVWESARRLAKTTVEWRLTDGDTRYEGIAALFSAEVSRTAKAAGKLRFQFPGLLIPILKDPRRFARLRTHFMIELSGKYAVTLYELLESVANKDVPTMKADVEELRSWLKVPEGKLLRWQDFRRYVLEPAVKQINGNPEGAGFRVRMKIQKEGRAIKWVVFEVIKTKERQAIDEKLRIREKQLSLFDVRLLSAATRNCGQTSGLKMSLSPVPFSSRNSSCLNFLSLLHPPFCSSPFSFFQAMMCRSLT
jgi:hypothetical protein